MHPPLSVPPSGLFRGSTVQTVLFGAGSAARWREVPELEGARALLVTTPSVARSALFEAVTSLLASVLISTFRQTRQHAPVSVVERLAEHISECGATAVVSLGGGSVIDTAKAAIDRARGRLKTYLPHVAIPTTLSAAEFAQSYGTTDDETRRKRRGSDPSLLPRAVILDAEMTVYTPDWLWLGSGLRALDHCVETVYAPDHNPVADALALEGIRLLFRNLPASVPAAEHVLERQQAQIAAWLSFAVSASVTLGTSHRLGRVLGPMYTVPHGFTSSILLPHVMRARLSETQDQQARIAQAAQMGVENGEPQGAGRAAEMVADLVRRLGLPARLRDVGVPREDLTGLAAGSALDLHILEAAW
jgi:maleylacetate reductase